MEDRPAVTPGTRGRRPGRGGPRSDPLVPNAFRIGTAAGRIRSAARRPAGPLAGLGGPRAGSGDRALAGPDGVLARPDGVSSSPDRAPARATACRPGLTASRLRPTVRRPGPTASRLRPTGPTASRLRPTACRLGDRVPAGLMGSRLRPAARRPGLTRLASARPLAGPGQEVHDRVTRARDPLRTVSVSPAVGVAVAGRSAAATPVARARGLRDPPGAGRARDGNRGAPGPLLPGARRPDARVRRSGWGGGGVFRLRAGMRTRAGTAGAAGSCSG